MTTNNEAKVLTAEDRAEFFAKAKRYNAGTMSMHMALEQENARLRLRVLQDYVPDTVDCGKLGVWLDTIGCLRKVSRHTSCIPQIGSAT